MAGSPLFLFSEVVVVVAAEVEVSVGKKKKRTVGGISSSL